MKHVLLSFLIVSFSLQIFAQIQKEEEIIFCNVEDKPNVVVKLTKTHDKLYSLYVTNKKTRNAKWQKIMDLDEPVVWTKNGIGEVADFYSLDSYNYWLRLFFDNNYAASGDGEFLTPRSNDPDGTEDPDKFIVNGCKGTLK